MESLDPAFVANRNAAFSLEIAGQERLVVAQELNRNAYRHLSSPQVRRMVTRIRQRILLRYLIDVYGIILLKPGTLPTTSSGKIQRRVAQQQFLTNTLPISEQWICPSQDQFNFDRWGLLLFGLNQINGLWTLKHLILSALGFR